MKVVLCSKFISDSYLAKLYRAVQGFPVDETCYPFTDYYMRSNQHFYYLMANPLLEKDGIVQLRFSTAPRIRYRIPISELREHLLQLDSCELPFLRAA